MGEARLTLRTEADDDGTLRVVAPAVGIWSGHPREGDDVAAGSTVGILEQLKRRFRLVLPDDVAGVVSGVPETLRRVPVEFGETLFRLRAVGAAAERTAAGADALEEGTAAIVAPTDGVFYRSPRPDAPPFVSPGATVTHGQAVGLVEVMKTFNQILYGGQGLPDEATVVEIRCEDGEEVRAGQVLLVVR